VGRRPEALRVRLSPWLDEPVPPALAAVVQRGAPGSAALRRPVVLPRWAMAASAAGLLLLGGVLGGRWGCGSGSRCRGAGTAGCRWRRRGRADRAGCSARPPRTAVYVPEPRHAVEVKAQEEHLARWLTRRIDVPVKLFDLRERRASSWWAAACCPTAPARARS
jgi:anti-sigma factor RsiW